ncbi:MAG: SRPBCC domain-containing protein [Patescibacteria group bacterium]
MQKIHFTITINAPKEKVWHTMLDKETYTQWTTAFSPNSTYQGDWSEGSEIRFVDTSGSGMFSKIKENRMYEFVSIEHLGMVSSGVIDTTSDEVKKWTPAFENYTFTEDGEVTTVNVDMDVNDEYKDSFNEMWPKALQALKELAEK